MNLNGDHRREIRKIEKAAMKELEESKDLSLETVATGPDNHTMVFLIAI